MREITIGFKTTGVSLVICLSSILFGCRNSQRASEGGSRMKVMPANALMCASEVPRPEADRYIVLTVRRTGETKSPAVTVQKQAVDWSDLESTLAIVMHSRSSKIVFLEIDRTLEREKVSEVIGILNKVGVDTVCMIDPVHPPDFPQPSPASAAPRE